MPITHRMVPLFLGAGMLIALLVEVWVWRGGGVRLPLPLAHGQGVPLPLLFWTLLGLYAWSCGHAFRFSTPERWARMARLGFSLHILAVFADLVHRLTSPPPELATSYLRYGVALWTIVLGAAAWASGRMFAQWRSQRMTRSALFYLPLMVGVGVFMAFSWMLAPGLTLASMVAGLLTLYGQKVGALRGIAMRGRAVMRDERGFLALVMLVALAFRLFYVLRVMTNPDFLNTGSDGPTYDALAWSVLRGEPLPTWVPWWAIHWFSPGYVRFLALLYALVGRNYFIVCLIQSLIGVGACVLLYDVTKRLFDPATARVAALFGAVNFPMIFAAASLGHQALDLFLTLALMWCLVRYLQSLHRWGRWMIGIGLLLGVAAATREGHMAFWIFLGGWLLLGVRRRIGWRASLGQFLALSLGLFVVLIPMVWGSGSGVRARLELQWFYERYTTTPMNAWFNPWRDPGAAWMLLREEPLTVISNVTEALIANFNAIFFNQGYGLFDPVFLLRWSPYYYAMWVYAYLLAFGGLALVIRQAWHAPMQRLAWWLLVGLLVSRTLVHLFFQAAYRHRTPLEPFLIMLAAYALTQLLAVRPSRS